MRIFALFTFMVLMLYSFTAQGQFGSQTKLGKKMKDKQITLNENLLAIGDTLELNKGSNSKDGNFLYIFAIIGQTPSPLDASMKNEKLIIDHFRYVKSKYGEMHIVVAMVGPILYNIDYVKAVKEGEIKN